MGWLELYFAVIAVCLTCIGMFTYFASRAKSYEEEMKWEDRLAIATAVFFTFIGITMATILFLP